MAATVNEKKCDGCQKCVSECPVDAISLTNGLAVINAEQCTSCGACASACPTEAIVVD